jgi:hypothetical protein
MATVAVITMLAVAIALLAWGFVAMEDAASAPLMRR